MAINSIGPLSLKLRSVVKLSQRLVGFLGENDSKVWDVAIMSLKSLVESIELTNTVQIENMLQIVLPALIGKMSLDTVDLEFIDLFTLSINRFQLIFKQDQQLHPKLLKCLLLLIVNERPVVRKRSILLMTAFASLTTPELFNNLAAELMKLLNTVKEDKIETILNSLSQLCNVDSVKMKLYVTQIGAKTMQLVEIENDTVKEASLNTFEVLIKLDMLQEDQLQSVLKLSLDLLKYDPNYNEDADMEDDDMSQGSFEEESDAEDESWKVRRASAKLLAEIASKGVNEHLYSNLAVPLMDRFNERVEIVRIDILCAFGALVKGINSNFGEHLTKRRKLILGSGDVSQNAVKSMLQNHVPQTITLLVKQFNNNSLATIEIGFQLLGDVCLVLNGGLSGSIDSLKGPIASILSIKKQSASTSTNLKIKLLEFLSIVLEFHEASKIWQFLDDISDSIIQSTMDKFYKVRVQALIFIQKLALAIHTSLQESPMEHPDHERLVKKLLNGSLYLLENDEIEQEVVEQAILTSCQLISKFKVASQDQLQKTLIPEIINNLKRESLRDSCLISVGELIRSCDNVDWKPLVENIQGLLKGSSRHTSGLAINCLVLLVSVLGENISKNDLEQLMNDIPYLLDNADTHFVLDLLTSLLPVGHNSNAFKQSLTSVVVPKIITMVQLQPHIFGGKAFESLTKLFTFMFQFDEQYASFNNFVPTIINDCKKDQVPKDSYPLLSKLVARSYNLPQSQILLSDLIKSIQSTKTNENELIFSLYCVGELGTLW